jgi:hypothetical protein
MIEWIVEFECGDALTPDAVAAEFDHEICAGPSSRRQKRKAAPDWTPLRARLPDILLIAKAGMIVGAGFAVWQVAASHRASDSPPNLQRVSPARWALLFTLGGVAAGASTGLLRSLANHATDAALVGVAAAIPINVAADIFIFPVRPT